MNTLLRRNLKSYLVMLQFIKHIRKSRIILESLERITYSMVNDNKWINRFERVNIEQSSDILRETNIEIDEWIEE